MLSPVGKSCEWCREAIVEGDRGVCLWTFSDSGNEYRPWHIECHIRSVVGSVEHQTKKRCDGSCHDDPQLSKREAARRAMEYSATKSRATNPPEAER